MSAIATLEFGASILSLGAAFLFPRAFERAASAFGAIARKPALAISAVALSPLLIRALLLPVLGEPLPAAHDEFSYLLAADTFAHGRVANPVHPFATHFETFHVLVRPAYVSIYPPAQGMALGLGQAITGHPWAGVWISVGLMSAAICWALNGWLPPEWAFFGSWLFAMRIGIFSYWMNSYWGGAVAACGGALVLGAVPRMVNHPRAQAEGPLCASGKRSRMAGVWMGIGLAILANSRPFEGLVFAALMLGVACWKGGRFPDVRYTALVLAIAAAAMGYYFWRATGSPFQMPYTVYQRTMEGSPHFVWQTPEPAPVLHHEILRKFHQWWLDTWRQARSLPVSKLLSERITSDWRFFVGVLFTIPLLALVRRWRDRDVLLLAGSLALFFAIALATQVWPNPHYAAPGTALIALLIAMGMRELAGWKPGLVIVRALPAALILTMFIGTGARGGNRPGSRWASWGNWETPRSLAIEELKKSGGRHLVIVRYGPDHDVNDEWVYNRADIDASEIVWAREMGPSQDDGLIHYFHDRKVWLAEPDAVSARISAYPSEYVSRP